MQLEIGLDFRCSAVDLEFAAAEVDPPVVVVDLEIQTRDLFFEETWPSSLERKLTIRFTFNKFLVFYL